MNPNEQLTKLLMASRQPSYAGEPQYFDTTNYDQIFADQNARNQQANAVNARLDQQQRRGSELTQLDEMIASQDRYKARKNTELASPLYKEEQAKSNAQGLAQALLGTKQVESMSYGGNPVKQSPDGKYWLENGQEVTDVANIQTNNKFDPIAGSLQAMQSGNPLALQALQEQMKPKSGMDLADKMALLQQQSLYKREEDALNPKKDTGLKQRDLTSAMTSLGAKDYYSSDNRNIFTALNEASDDPKQFDATIAAINDNTSDGWWRQLVPFLPNKALDTSGFTQAIQNFKTKNK